jgi:hypothetical protein
MFRTDSRTETVRRAHAALAAAVAYWDHPLPPPPLPAEPATPAAEALERLYGHFVPAPAARPPLSAAGRAAAAPEATPPAAPPA